MTLKEKLISDIEKLPEDAVKEMFEFLLSIKKKMSSKNVDDEYDIWTMFETAGIEAEEDASVQHDHYIHGTPKINQ